jgi:O-antigen/teichoic acid export membrane protein
MWCQLSGYRFVVEHHWGLVALGIMSIGLQIPSQIGVLVESLVMQFLYPYFYSHINQDMTKHGLDEAMSDLVNVVIPIYILICGGIMLGGPYLVKLIVGANFQVTSNLLAIGAFIELFRMSANLLGNAAHAKQKTSLLTMPYFVGAATIFILLIVASVFEVSIDDAAFSLVIGGILMCSYMAAKIFCSIRIHFSKGKYIALLFLLASMTVGSFFLPEIDGIIPNLLALCIAGVFIFIMLVIFLRRSIALKRILSVPLKVG